MVSSPSRLLSESQYTQHEVDELVQMLAEAQSLDEQADILHYLVNAYGLEYKIKVTHVSSMRGRCVRTGTDHLTFVSVRGDRLCACVAAHAVRGRVSEEELGDRETRGGILGKEGGGPVEICHGSPCQAETGSEVIILTMDTFAV